MKKIMMLLIAAVMLFGVTGQAMAYFASGDLIQVVYQKGGSMEVATDLGAFDPTTPQTYSANPFPAAGTGTFSTAQWSDLQVAYYVTDGGSIPAVYLSGSSAAGQSSNNQTSAAQTLKNLNAKYASISSGHAQVSLAQSNTASYYYKEDKNNAALYGGGWAGFIPAQDGETNLGALSTPGASVDSYVYFYGDTSTASAGVQKGVIHTSSGTASFAPTATPIPASVLLLGSGLMGLVGMRRKQSV